MELSVRPDDLAGAAAALRRCAADLDAALHRFDAAAGACLARLPEAAAGPTRDALRDARQAATVTVRAQRTAAEGLHAVAAAYVATDRAALRPTGRH